MDGFMQAIDAWTGVVRDAAPALVLCLVTPLFLLLLLRSRGGRLADALARRSPWVARLLLAAAFVLGYRSVFSQQALFDDAYISLRYAQNFAEGQGLVWNVGEAVEGYTNFLWTLLIGLAIRFSRIEAPFLALLFSWICFGANLLIAGRIERRLLDGSRLPLPIPLAPLCLALLPLFGAYGSTGMETGMCALLVSLGLLALLAPPTRRSTALAGLALIAATLCRPDHALFYVVGSGLVFWEAVRSWRASSEVRPAVGLCLAYAAPFAIYLAYLAWKIPFYGELLPNTYYAKSADISWYSQGLTYLGLFLLGSNAWVPVGLLGLALLRIGRSQDPSGALGRFRFFAAAAVPIYTLYVLKVGGDFMYGRFFVPLLPLLFVGACLGLRMMIPQEGLRAAPRSWLPAAAGAGLLLASLQPMDLPRGTTKLFGVVNESNYYPVTQLRPHVVVKHSHHSIGTLLRDQVAAKGLRPVLGTGGIGMVGYYSGLPLVDVRGLTDPVVARQPLSKRTRPGHEKVAPRRYLIKRGVDLLRSRAGQRGFHPKRFRSLAHLKFPGSRDPWQLARYNTALLTDLAEAIPGLRFQRFPAWLDRYIGDLPAKKTAQIKKDLKWFRRYYFDHNKDPERLLVLEAASRGDLPATEESPEEAPDVP